MARFSGFLSESDPDELEEMDSANEDNRQARFRIRQRAARALRDFVILESNLPDSSTERGEIFKTALDEELWRHERDAELILGDIVEDIISFTVRGYYEHKGNIPEVLLENSIRTACNRSRPDAHVEVDIRFRSGEHLDSLYDRYRSDPDSLNQEELKALLESGRITYEQWDQITMRRQEE